MRRVWQLVALGVGAYLLVLVLTFPAGRISGLVEEQVADLSLNGVSGSILSGSALQVVYQGLDLGKLHWRLRPQALLLGRLEYRVTLDSPANRGHFNIGRSLGGRTRVTDVDLRLIADPLVNHYSLVEVTTGGTLQLVFDEFSPDADFSGDVSGQVIWPDAVIMTPLNLLLGDLVMDVTLENGELIGRLPESGTARASGELGLSAESAWRTRLLLRDVHTPDGDTRAILEGVATQQPNGAYLIDRSGQF